MFQHIEEFGSKAEEEEVPLSDLAQEKIRKAFYTKAIGAIDPKGKFMVPSQAVDVENDAKKQEKTFLKKALMTDLLREVDHK